MLFKSLSSLSENLRSWSADVPLKNPEAVSKSHSMSGSRVYRGTCPVSSPASAIFTALTKTRFWQSQHSVVVAVADRQNAARE